MSEPQEVVVKDVQMKFGSMVVFMLKWTLAAIPAMIILASLVGIGAGLFGAFLKVSSPGG